MRKYFTPLPLSPLARMVAYLLAFTVETTALELVRQLMPLRSHLFFGLALAVIIIFPIVGTILFSRRTILSYAVSGATMLLLSTATLSFSSFPTYLLLFAFGSSYLGSRAFFHQAAHNKTRSLVYSTYAVIVGIVGSMGLAYALLLINNLMYSHYPS